ncbi:DUF4390 domain-containing protein [bacterium]|nr:DUF4390 domain-containing protein [bacterium]
MSRAGAGWALGIALAAAALAAAAPALAAPALTLAAARLAGPELSVEIALTGFVDEKLQADLEAGLPAALLLRWRLWERRAGWPDRALADGLLREQLFYDLLEARYTLFDARGRPRARCADAAALAAALAAPRRLVFPLPAAVPAGRVPAPEIEARLEPLTREELQELERWLAGGESRGAGGLLGGLRGGPERLLRRLAGLSSRQASARCAVTAP